MSDLRTSAMPINPSATPTAQDIVERLRGNTTLSYAEVCRAADTITALRQRVAELEAAADRLANAADAVGVQFFDTDTMSPEVEEMQEATLAVRALVTKP